MRAWRCARSNAQLPSLITKRYVSSTPGEAGIAGLLARQDDVEDSTVNGWIRSLRKQKKVAFAAIQDGSTIDSLQAVLKPEQAEGQVFHSNVLDIH
jgi:asparaginyl-tRNA synthetase